MKSLNDVRKNFVDECLKPVSAEDVEKLQKAVDTKEYAAMEKTFTTKYGAPR